MSRIPMGQIEDSTANFMKALFRNNKFNALPDPGDGNGERKSFSFSVKDFYGLIKNVIGYGTNRIGNYDGIRIYFGVLYSDGNDNAAYRILSPNATNDNRFVLIFLPTKKIDNGMEIYHQDQTDYIYATTGDKVAKVVNINAASAWVQKYLSERAQYLTDDGNVFLYGSRRGDFMESKCIWYDKNIFSYNNSENPNLCGILEYLNENDLNIINIEIFLAAIFQEGLISRSLYHLTLVFFINENADAGKNYSFTKNINQFDSKILTNAKEDFMKSVSADTGNPCPPPNPASQCAGAVLPF